MYLQDISTDEPTGFLEPSLLWREPTLTNLTCTTFPLTNDPWAFWDSGVLDCSPENKSPMSDDSNHFLNHLDTPSVIPETDKPAYADLSTMTSKIQNWDQVPQQSPEREISSLEDKTVVRQRRSNRSSPGRQTPSKKSPKPGNQRCRSRRSSSDEEPSPSRILKLQEHSAVERRYRSNLSSRFNELKKCLPSLQGTADRFSSGSDQESVADAAGGASITKATILATAVQYIMDMKKQNARISAERDDWKSRFQAYENLILQRTLTCGSS